MTYPLSIFILYSPSRRPQFEQFARLLSRCEQYQKCQKILVADSTTDITPEGYDIVAVPRSSQHFCWSDAWSAAMAAVKSDKVLYLDCDRVLPTWYLTHIIDTLKDYEFAHPSCLWNLTRYVNDDKLIDRRNLDPNIYWPEFPTANSIFLPCRGPMSGTSAFTVKSYEFVGPLDRSYICWGYPDLEYQEMIKSKGCIFRPIESVVLHLHHSYEIGGLAFAKVNAWNGARFFTKWKLPFTKSFLNSLTTIGITVEELLKASIDEMLS